MSFAAETGPASYDLETSLEWIRSQKFKKQTKLPSEATVKILRKLTANSHTRVRGAALRACRFICGINTPRGVELLNKNRLHLMATRSLERESRFLEERMQALKLLRAMAQYCPEKVPRTLIRSLVSIATHRDDQLKEAALESLREYSLLNTRAVAECGGVSAMVSAILDPTMTHMADSLLLTILHLLNQKDTRMWLRPSLDLAALLAPFTSSDGALDGEEDRRVRRRLSRHAIVTMMRTWTGLFILQSDPQGLRSLVQMLVQPVSFELRKDVLDTILEVFNTVNPLRAASFGSAHFMGRGSRGESDEDRDDEETHGGYYGAEPYMAEFWGVGPGAAGSKELAAGGFHAERVPGRHAHMHTLLDNYLVMVLLAFVQCGLVEALVELSVSSAPPMSRTATQLLSFVSRFSTRLLPGSVSRRLLSQKKLVASAVDAARAGEVVDRARAQRAAHVIGLLSRIVGSGYDTALATLLSRSTYEDGVALASELALAGSLERAHLNLGVFPRSIVVSKPTITELLTSQPKMAAMETSPNIIPSRSNSNSGGTSMMGKLKRMSQRFIPSSSKDESNFPVFETPPDTLVGDDDQANLAVPLVANRGHRRLVQQLVMTDMSQMKKTNSTSVANLSEDLKKLLDKARILIKVERREWKIWDWVAIDEIISGPCQTPSICAEILKTKFFKRLSAFYSVSSAGPFAKLAWEPDCVTYTNVATSMLRVLLNLPEAQEFLIEDRRGRIAAQISEALQKELHHAEDADGFEKAQTAAEAGNRGATGFGGDRDGISSNRRRDLDDDDEDDFDQTGFVGDRVFTSHACSTTMTREYFVLLGVFASSPKGVFLLEQLGVFATLHRLALHREKDYLLRLAISSLDYSGPSAEKPREWLQLILMNVKVSPDLRHFAIGFFRSMLRSAQNQDKKIAQWILGLIFAQIKFQEVTSDALSVLIEASHYPMYLEIMVEMIEGTLRGEKNELTVHKEILERPVARRLLMKLLGSETGVKALKSLGWLGMMFNEWKDGEYAGYLHKIDTALLHQLVDQKESNSKKNSVPKPIPVRAHEASALSEPGFTASELQWLFRMPWRIDVCLSSSIGQIRVPMDAFIDCSQLRPESLFSSEEEDEHGQKIIRGICVTAVPPWSRDKDADKRQRARPFIVPEDATVYACLNLANLPIDRRGRTTPSPVAGGGYPYSSGGIRTDGDHHADSGTIGWAEGKIRNFASKKNLGKSHTSLGGGRPSGLSEDLGIDDDAFGGPFAEANGGGPEDFARPVTDDRFWIKCDPPSRKSHHKQASKRGKNTFTYCPTDSPATLQFSTLDSDHRDSMTRTNSKDLERDTPAEIIKSNEPEVRVVNPLLALKKDKGPSAAVQGAGVYRPDELPPLLVLKEVRFYLDLVPLRFASPSIPVHLLGELAKTECGMDEIAEAGLMANFLSKIRNSNGPSSERRAALWAIGHIGASEYGFHRLEQEDATFVRSVHAVAVEASCLSLRGTACYTLGLFSRHRVGCLALHQLGWATLDTRSHPFATIAVPARSSTSPFHLPGGRYTVLDVSGSLNVPVDGVLNQDDVVSSFTVTGAEFQKALACISDLSNHIAQKEAHSELTKMKDANPTLFSDVRFYLAVHDLLARFSYELPVRQYVLGLFHSKISFENEKTWQIIDAEPHH